MNVCLKPVDELGMDDIHIEDKLLSVGRQEEPFSSCDHSLVSKLSRKHARIFEEEDALYVVDLGSLNGTKLNGQPVSEIPIKLKRGDKLAFAGLTFQVEMEDVTNGSKVDTENAIGVVLTPESETNGQPILITEFPFLVSKSEGVFYENKARFTTIHQYISRRHAYIFIKNDHVYIEDLNSTNGTYKNDSKLEEEPERLDSDDVVAFGDRKLRFLVKILKPEQSGAYQTAEDDVTASDKTSILGEEPSASGTTSSSPLETSQYGDFEAEPGTILVDRASPFLDIFCPESDSAASQPEPSERLESEPKGKTESHKSSSIFRRLFVFLCELKMVLSGNGNAQDNSNRYGLVKKTGIICFIVVGAAALVSVLIFRESAENDIKSLIAEGQYQDAARMANRYLADNASDQFVIRLADEALLKAVVPEWQLSIEHGGFNEADSLLEQAIETSPHNEKGLQALKLLLLVGDFERFIQGHETETLTHIYLTEDKISSLLNLWRADESGYRQVMDRISSVVPAFQVDHAKLYSRLRMLSAEQDLYGKPLKLLKKEVTSSLNDDSPGTPENLSIVIARFIEKYPSVGGVKALDDDLKSYLLIKAAVIADDPIALKQLAEHLQFKTPPFKQKVQSLLVNIPTDEFVAKIRQADLLWGNGQLDSAITTLQRLQEQSETRLVGTLIKRYQDVRERWDALGGIDGAPYAKEQLIELFKLLDKEKDVYLWSALQSEFKTLELDIQKQASEHVNNARVAWTEYLKNGGIWGALRLETEISATYVQQAKLLSEAYQQLSQGVALYGILNIEKPNEITVFEEQVKGEATRQIKWINDLHLVLNQQTRDEKTIQLPSEEER